MSGAFFSTLLAVEDCAWCLDGDKITAVLCDVQVEVYTCMLSFECLVGFEVGSGIVNPVAGTVPMLCRKTLQV